jgi:signal transduction histidine kinase
LSWIRRLLPRSLRARLVLAFAGLIFISLSLAGVATVYLLADEQEKTAREKVGRLAEPVALRTAILEASGYNASQILIALEIEYPDLRILVVDSEATVVGDTGQTLRGQTISQLQEQGVPARPLPQGPLPARPLPDSRFRVQRGPESLLLFTSPQGVLVTIPGPGGVLVPRYQAVLAVPESDISQAWRDLLPRLGLAAGVALFVGVVVASLLTRSIARPLRRITDASEAMARGEYQQQIPAYGGEEVGRLAEAFNKMAKQVDASHRTLRDFLANVSHELKTPLTAVQGFSQALLDGTLRRPREFEEAGRIINEESIRMRALVDDLLYLSQAEGGQLALDIREVDPRELLSATTERFQHRSEDAGISLVLVAEDAPERVAVDARRMEQALTNLVDNALRYTPAGGRVTLRSFAENGHARISVHNTGSVIPPEALPRVWDRFFRVDSSRSRADGNSGLGLAITREIVELHGGSVSVASSEEEGTEFVITLPLPAAREADDGPRRRRQT